MTESPEQRVARLEAELAQAKVDALQKQLAAARSAAGVPPGVPPGVGYPTGPPDPAPALRGPVHLEPRVSVTKADPGGSTWLPGAASESDSAGVVDGRRHRHHSASSNHQPPLTAAPRAVPWVFKLVAFPFSFWTLFALFMVSVSPIALWIFIPISGAIAAGLTFLIVATLMLRRRHLRHTLLRWGEVADVTGQDTLSAGTYYSGTTYSNVRLTQAHGWTVTRRWYSGPGYKTKVTYRIGGQEGSIVIRGLPYDDGVILADPRRPERALCVSAFPYDLSIDGSGNWVGNLPNRVLASSVLMTVILLGWTATMIILLTKQSMDMSGLVRGN